MREQILAAVRGANQSYLEHFLARNPPELHAGMRANFERHMVEIAEYCLAGYGGAGTLTTDFIRGLHRRLFPPGYVQYAVNPQGEKVVFMVPGEYKTMENKARITLTDASRMFAPPGEVVAGMENVVTTLNATLGVAEDAPAKRDAILWFILDFLTIHPFCDANGRVASIFADLLLIREGLVPIDFPAIKEKDSEGLNLAVELARRNRDLAPFHAVIRRWRREALAG